MIYSISADKPSFKTINLKSGFNVVLAERTKESTQKDSRNGLGKSTLIEIIHFCLGGDKGLTLSKEQLDNWTFTIKLDLTGKVYSISRNTSDLNKIIIEGDCSNWPIKPIISEETKKQTLSRNEWTKVLGASMFDLQIDYSYKYHPTFRSLISYFVRKSVQSGAFLTPFEQHKNQLEWDMQINNAYLLGLGWEYAAKWQVLKDRKKVLSQITQEATTEIMSHLVGNIGELEASKIRLEAKAKEEKENLDNFKVHPQYNQIENDANLITRSIHEKVNQNIDERRLLEYYEISLKEEIDAKSALVLQVYQEAGLIFPERVSKRMEEVLFFHKNIVTNRKEFLNSEIERIKQDISKRAIDINNLNTKKADIMQTLKTHGALQEYTQLQSNHQITIAQLKDVSLRLENLKSFEQGKSTILVEQELLQQEANIDFNERKDQRRIAVLAFNSYSEALYKTPGALAINITKTGYKFDVKIQRSGSHGIGNMEIFCYDLTLAKIWARKIKNSFFLIHDSFMFADVDERQTALALQLAEEVSRTEGFQYICTMNSDTVPRKEFNDGFNFDSFIRGILTDVDETGSLLGIRF